MKITMFLGLVNIRPALLNAVSSVVPWIGSQHERPANLSSVEKIKLASNYLRGTIAEELANGQDTFADETISYSSTTACTA